MSKFTHLHVHSTYSLLDGMNRVSDRTEKIEDESGRIIREDLRPSIANLCCQRGMESIGLTDHGVLNGHLEFQKECAKHKVKPIFGVELYMAIDRHVKSKEGLAEVDPLGKNYYHLILLAKDEKGFQNLSHICSEANRTGFYYKPRADFDLLENYSEGLIASSACLGGHLAQYFLKERSKKEIWNTLDRYVNIFGDDFYIEIQDNDVEEQYPVNDELVSLANEKGIPYILTGDCHFPSAEDFELHKKFIAMSTNTTVDEWHKYPYTPRHCIESPEEVGQNLDPEVRRIAMENTQLISEKCNHVIPTGTFVMPTVSLPDNTTAEDQLRKLVFDGLEDFRKKSYPPFKEGIPQSYTDRIEMELDAINSLGFADYFLVILDIYNFCGRSGIRTGPGRGSVAGSAAAWAIGIISPVLDPVKYGMFFERFLNKGRMESGGVPDIDMDFDIERRSEVFDYITEHWGKDYSARIITYQKMRPKGTIRGLIRADGRDYIEGDKLAKMVPAPKAGKEYSLLKCLQIEPKFEEQEPELMSEVARLEDLCKSSGMHAGGIVISSEPVEQKVPVQRAKDGTLITAWDKDLTEEAGLIKFDILGLRNLTIINTCLGLVKKKYDQDIDLDTIDFDDQEVYKQFWEGDTIGVFQFESSKGFIELCQKIRPSKLEDLSSITALYRPGPIKAGIVNQFIVNRNQKEIPFLTPELEPILNWTAGCMVYQEQIMQIAQQLAGFTLMEADNLRKAVGKKKEELIEAQKKPFLAGCKKNSIRDEISEKIFSEIEQFGDYGFNLAHALAYSVLSFQTAWLKTYYKKEFLTALFIHSDEDRIIRYLNYARTNDISVLPPCVNQSEENFTLDEADCIRFGLEGVKGCGAVAAAQMISIRDEEGPYESVEEFVERNCFTGTKVNRKVMESLVLSGAMDSLI